MKGGIGAAFVLGAGLGTRLRALTADRPKPLVPIFGKPLITFAFDHLRAAGVSKFVVNTHHRPEAYGTYLGAKDGRAEYEGLPVHLRHEPVLLDTGGGIKNVEDLLGDASFLVQNGDVLADVPLDRLIERHLNVGNVATLLLRSSGGPAQVQLNDATGLVTDIRGAIGGRTEPAYLFSGIYVLSPQIFRHIPAGEVVSIVPVFLEMIAAGERVGGIVLDEGTWFDLGTRESYLEAHRRFARPESALSYPLDRAWPEFVHPTAKIGEGATFEGVCAIGAGAEIGSGTYMRDSVMWENAKIASRSRLSACIVREGRSAEGELSNADI